MVNNDFLAHEIETELNEIAQNDGLVFKIHSAVGDYKDPTLIQSNGKLQSYTNGVLRMLDGQYASLSDIEDLFSEYLLEFAVKQEERGLVESVLQSWVYLRLGEAKIVSGNETSYILTPTPPLAGTAKDAGKTGAMLTYSINIKVQSIRNGVLSNMVKWYIKTDAEYVEVKRLRASFVSVRTPNPKAIANAEDMRTTNSYASNQVTMELPYVANNKVLQEIESDILTSNKDRIYTIKRVSGAVEHEDIYVLANGSINEEDGAVVGLQLVFSPTKGVSNAV